MRPQRVIIPVMFALLLVLAYVVAAQTNDYWPEPYAASPLAVLQVDDLALPVSDPLADVPPVIDPRVCEAP